MPMAARYFDVGPLCSIRHAFKSGMAVSMTGVTTNDGQSRSAILRIPYTEYKESYLREDNAGHDSKYSKVETIIGNACLLRITGRPSFMFGIAEYLRKKLPDDDKGSFIAGLFTFSCPEEKIHS